MSGPVRSSVSSVLVVVLVALATACGSEAPAPAPAPPAADLVANGEHEVPAADGVSMRYAVRGANHRGPTVLFVHGWMGRFTFFDLNAPAIAEAYRTIAIDLPGHGVSGAGRADWTVAALGDDLAHFVETLDLRDVILVGHSMGGPVALRAASLVPDRVLAVIGVDTFQNVEFEFDPEPMGRFLTAYEADFAGTCARFVDAMFAPGAEGVVKETVRADMCGGDPAVAIALLRDFMTWDHAGTLRAAGAKPVRAINAATLPTEIEINRKYAPDFDAVLIDGVGHFLFLERPEEFNAVLDAMIEEIAGG